MCVFPLPLQLVSEGNGELSLLFDSSRSLAGYQFAFTQLPEGASIVGSTGADAGTLPLTYNDGTHIGLGFSMSGASIPPRVSESRDAKDMLKEERGTRPYVSLLRILYVFLSRAPRASLSTSRSTSLGYTA